MALDFKPLNRQQDYTVQQKAAIKKLFTAACEFATSADAASGKIISRSGVHTVMAGDFSGDEKHDMQRVFKWVRLKITNENAPNIDGMDEAFMGYRSTGNKKKVIRELAQYVAENCVTSGG